MTHEKNVTFLSQDGNPFGKAARGCFINYYPYAHLCGLILCESGIPEQREIKAVILGTVTSLGDGFPVQGCETLSRKVPLILRTALFGIFFSVANGSFVSVIALSCFSQQFQLG